MTDEHRPLCGERTPSRDPRDHTCIRTKHHTGAHACTCPHRWWEDTTMLHGTDDEDASA